jgi:predicted nucleic acid-binding protein
MNKVLLDASSAILFYKTGLLEDLVSVYRIFVARSVQEELTCKGRPGADKFAHFVTAETIKVIDVENVVPNYKVVSCELRSLDKGELDTIICLKVGMGDFIITDDGKAARYCKNKTLPFINALLFPRLLYFAGFISLQGSKMKMEAIIHIGRYSPQITAWAFTCAKETLAFAIPKKVEY